MTLWVFDISVAELCLAGLMLLAFVYEVYFYVRYQMSGIRGQASDDSGQLSEGVSVIVCARNEGYNLEAYVQSLLTQDYPTFEIILVNDGSEDDTRAVMDDYASQDQRVRTTFVPYGARVGSTKKLGLTLAAKAAKYDYLLLTDADCRPESNHWISSMMSGFANPQTEIVLGYGAYFSENSLLNDLIQYDTLFNGLHYMGAASTGKPYMGIGRNLAYRKQTFFGRGGFSDQMTECAGDDDLFVNKVATAENTVVVNTRDSITWSVPKTTWKDWLQQKRRHLSVSSAYKPATRSHLVNEPLARGLFYAALVALFVIGEPLSMAFAYVLFVARLIMQLVVLNRGARALGQPAIGLELIWHDITLPLLTLVLMSGKKKKTW